MLALILGMPRPGRALDETLATVRIFHPAFLVIAAGFDLVQGDPSATTGGFRVTVDGLEQVSRRLAGVRLDLEEIPVRLRCRSCGAEFTVEQGATPFAPCPACGEELGHAVLSGRELYIEYLELE